MGCFRLFCCFWVIWIQQPGYAQMPVFNSDFNRCSQEISTKGELADSLRVMGIVDRAYDIQGTRVIEYYEMNTSRFVGFAGDTTKFELRRLPYLSRTPMMRRFVREFGPETAHDIREGLLVPGILMQDIVTLYGWPKKRRRENGLRTWIYEDFELQFDGQKLVNATDFRSGS